MANRICYDLRLRRTLCSSDGLIGKALEIYLNLQNPAEVIQLEEGLRLVLQGKTKSYKQSEEHTKLFADPKTTIVKSYIQPGTKEPIKGDYPTRHVYRLACHYNLTERNMNIINSGGHLQTSPIEDLQKKMDFIPPESD